MKLEHQVASLELSKRLEKLGVKQESYFVWWYTEAMSTDVKYFPGIDWEKREWKLKPRADDMKDSGRDIAAFTVAELGEMFTGYCFSRRTYSSAKDENWLCRWQNVHGINEKELYGRSEADARAKMLVYLLENKLITTNTNNHG